MSGGMPACDCGSPEDHSGECSLHRWALKQAREGKADRVVTTRDEWGVERIVGGNAKDR